MRNRSRPTAGSPARIAAGIAAGIAVALTVAAAVIAPLAGADVPGGPAVPTAPIAPIGPAATAPAAPTASAAPTAPTPPGTSAGSTSWITPTNGAALAGVVSLVVQSTDTTVQFSLDAEVLATVPVTKGRAVRSQPTAAFPDGSHLLTAKGCDTDVLGLVTCDSSTIVVIVDNAVATALGGGAAGSGAPTVPLQDASTFTDVDSFAVGGSGYGLVKITPVVAAGSGSPGSLRRLPVQLPLAGLTGRVTVTACPTTAGGTTCSGGTTQRVITVLSTAPVLSPPAVALVGPRHPLVLAFALAVGEPVALQVHHGASVYRRLIGSFPAGRSTYSWDGRIPGGLPDGQASVQLVRVGGGGTSVARRVTVEVHPPAIRRIRAAGAFAPGAGRSFRAVVTTNRPSQARLLVSRGGSLVATTSWGALAGVPVAQWSGLVHGKAPPGAYRYVVQLRDAAGNVASSRAASLTVR